MAKRLWAMGLHGDKIWLVTDHYNTDINADLKANLPGPPRWSGEEGRWEFPKKWETCTGARKIAEKWGADIKIKPDLLAWASEEKARQETIPDVQSMELVDLPTVRVEYPAIWAALSSRPFQTVGAAFAARNRACLIADQPGLGKTIQSIAAVIESGVKGPILVVAPKAAAQLTWPQELAHWLPGDPVTVIGSNLKSEERGNAVFDVVHKCDEVDNDDRHWILVSPNYLRVVTETDKYGNYTKPRKRVASGEGLVELLDTEWSAIIVDESHDTLAGCTGNKKNQSAQRQGLGALKVRDDGLRIALSGTPFRGKESYLWGQLNWLRPDLFRGYWAWTEKHFAVDKGGFGWSVGAMHDEAGIYEEAASVLIRRTKAEVAKDLPPKMYGGWPLDPADPGSAVAVWLDMLPKQKRAYESVVKSASAELEGGVLMTNGILAELTRLKQLASATGKMVGDDFETALPSNKFEWLTEYLAERGIEKGLTTAEGREKLPKIVVVSQFSQLIDAFYNGLFEAGIMCHKFTGDTSAKDRESIKDDWQNNPESHQRILLLTTKAGGVSLTLDAADEMVILDETWSASDQEQVEDRLHRLSRMHQVTIWKVFSRGTIEEGIARANLEREISIKSIIDGERGVDFKKLALGLVA